MFSPPFVLPFTMYITSLSQELSILFFGRRLKASTLSPVFLLFAPALCISPALVHNFPFFITYGKIYSAMQAAMIASMFPERKKLPILRKSKYQEFQCRKRHMFVATAPTWIPHGYWTKINFIIHILSHTSSYVKQPPSFSCLKSDGYLPVNAILFFLVYVSSLSFQWLPSSSVQYYIPRPRQWISLRKRQS